MPPYDYESDGYQEDWEDVAPANCGENFWDHEVVTTVEPWTAPICIRCGSTLWWPNDVAENAGRPFQAETIARYSEAFILQALENPGTSPAMREVYRRELDWRSLVGRIEAPGS